MTDAKKRRIERDLGEQGRYGIRGAPNTGKGKTFIKGGTPVMIDRHPERLIRGNDADIGGGQSGTTPAKITSTADVSAEQGQEADTRLEQIAREWWALSAEQPEGSVCERSYQAFGDATAKAVADNRALVEAIERHRGAGLNRAKADAALYAALETVSGQGEKP